MYHLTNVLVLTGRRGSGKDTFVEDLVKNNYFLREIGFKSGAVRLSFSDQLRYLSHELFDWCPLNPTYEEKDQPINHPSNVLGLTPREVWKHVAGDGPTSLRNIDPNLIVKRFAKANDLYINQNPNTLFVISDWRTLEEKVWVDEHTVAQQRIRILDGTGIPPKDSFEDHTDTFEVAGEVTNMRDKQFLDRCYVAVNKLFPTVA